MTTTADGESKVEPITHYVDRRGSLETTECCGIDARGGWFADGTPRSPDYFTIYPEYVTCGVQQTS